MIPSLLKEVGTSPRESFSAWQFVERAARGIDANSFPRGLIFFVGCVVAQSFESELDLEETRMPDEWLGYVSKTFVFSKEGLILLIRRLENKGYVSAQDAVEWVALEKEAALQQEHATDCVSRRYSPGATALFKRVNRECTNTLGLGITNDKKTNFQAA